MCKSRKFSSRLWQTFITVYALFSLITTQPIKPWCSIKLCCFDYILRAAHLSLDLLVYLPRGLKLGRKWKRRLNKIVWSSERKAWRPPWASTFWRMRPFYSCCPRISLARLCRSVWRMESFHGECSVTPKIKREIVRTHWFFTTVKNINNNAT